MAFQTSRLRDGEWVTETVYLQAALNASEASKSTNEPQAKPPACGILSRTVVASPIAHWVLPVRLRSKNHNDVAFIGTNFVQICEVDDDGQVHEILSKHDFDLRIRNAVVLGHGLDRGIDDGDPVDFIKPEDQDGLGGCSAPVEDTRARRLPPQFLALMLESGDLVFLFIRARLRGSGCRLEFVTKVESARGHSHTGYQLAVDPSSRYLAASSPDGILVIYELKSMLALNLQYSQLGLFDPVEATHLRAVQGVIHKVDFLYPRPQDDYHIILLLFIIRQERRHNSPVSRILTYEWELGDSLRVVFAEEKTGTRVPQEHSLPNLLIPLKFQSSILMISPGYIDIMKHILSGSPVIERPSVEIPSIRAFHFGSGEPVWTAWSRAFRLKEYFESKDIIYLAREDGAVMHLEFDSTDLSLTVSNVGAIDANLDTAFGATLDRFSDILIVGGDSGPGGVWKLSPRESLERISIIPNWAPVVDATTTYEGSSWNSGNIGDDSVRGRQKRFTANWAKPDSVFTASGRGLQGTITEWRTGIQARIGLDIETEEIIKQSWAFSEDDNGLEGLHVLLSVPQGTIVLRFSTDLSQATALTADATPFDLRTSTLYATVRMAQMVVQVTENSVTLVTPTQSSRFPLEELLELNHVIVQDAFCADDIIVLSTNSNELYHVHVLNINQMEVTRWSSWRVDGEVTCLSLISLGLRKYVVVGAMFNQIPRLSLHSLEGRVISSESLVLHQDLASEVKEPQRLEAMTSICVVVESSRGTDLIAGTRCGHLLTLRLQTETPITWSSEKIGLAPVKVYPSHSYASGPKEAFACYNGHVLMMRGFDPWTAKFKRKYFVWPTDSNDTLTASAAIDSIYSLRHSLSRLNGRKSLLAIAGSRVLLTEVWPNPGAVPRSIPLKGTPTRVIFSKTWNCLVVGLVVNSRPTLAFIDAHSGEHISAATDKSRKPVDYISGLGEANDRIHGLHEWLCVKDGKTFAFIIVTTQSGQLMVVSVEQEQPTRAKGSSRRLLYWTRYKKRLGLPIYAVVGDADGLIFCVKNVLHWNVLDLAEKKLKPVKEFELDSPATSLQVLGGKILALTTGHSLQIIDHRSEEGNAEMIHLHGDEVSRSTMHMIDVGDARNSDVEWPIVLLSDFEKCGLTGVWVPGRGARRNQELPSLIEGKLPSSVRRFVRAHCRPPWVAGQRQRLYGSLSSSVDDAEVLGLTSVGSMQHFTLLGIDLWRFLCLLQNLARRDPVLSPFTHVYNLKEELSLEPQSHRCAMLIDGDLLERCLKQRALERLVEFEDSYELFCRYLDGISGGKYTQTFRKDGIDCDGDVDVDPGTRAEKYVALGYDILEYLSAPVL